MAMRPADTADYRTLAKRRLPRMLFDYVDGGSYCENTLRRNVEDLARIQLRQRVLHDVSSLKLDTVLFGRKIAMPLILGPVGLAGMLAPRGELQAARAAEAADVPFCLSLMSICGLDEVASGTRTPWLQLYPLKDRACLRALLERATELDVPALVVTVDLAMPGPRYRDTRSGFSAASGFGPRLQRLVDGMTHPRWAWDLYAHGRPHGFGNLAGVQTSGAGLKGFWAWARDNNEPSVTWETLEWIRSHWSGPIVLKGILDPDDAGRAASAGVDGIVVSNHGGRQLDDCPSAIAALPRIVDAVDGRTTILFDSGVRSGLHVLKALALGADACMIGRPWAYALGARGGAGVTHLLEILRQELVIAMALTGCTDVRDASRAVLAPEPAREWA